ncbi:hypothetical protein AB3S75_019554 [Citrus x aurantiifolia]
MANPPNTSQEGVVGVESLEQNRGCEERRMQTKSYGKSKVTYVDALELHVATLETSMSATQGTLKSLKVKVNGFEGEYEKFTIATKALIQNQVDPLRREFRAFHDEFLKLSSFVQSEIRAIHTEVDEVHSYWAWYKPTLSISPTSTSLCDAHRINMPNLDAYGGARNATIIDNFVFRL